MGFYSEYDIELQSKHYIDKADELSSLQYQLWDLKDRLLTLEECLPTNPLDPQHDRYFYEDHVTEPYEIPCTIQGLLNAIKLVEEKIEKLKSEKIHRTLFIESIFRTEATPSGQYVLPICIFSPYELAEFAA